MKSKELIRRLAPAAVVFVAGVAAILPSSAYGLPYGNDLPHHYRMALAFYWATMLAEKSWVKIGFTQAGRWADYNRNFLFQREVYPETVWVLFVNIVAVAMLAMFLPALMLARRWR